MSSEYLAQTPEHWLVLRLKHVVSLRSDRVTGDAQQESYLGLENVESWTGKVTRPEKIAREEEKDNPENMVGVFHEGDILFGKLRPYLAKAFLADFSGVCSTEFLVMRPKDFVDPRYLLKAILTHQFIDEVDATTFGVRMPRANWDAISNIFIPIPPLATQRAITDYLDRETARIDGLIGAKQRLLGLLAEKRRALITHAVTRGLDPSATTRPSGVPWIGDVPAHWEVEYARWLFNLIDMRSTTGQEELLSVSHLTGVTRRADKDVNMFMAESLEGYKRCQPGDLVINTLWAWMGAMGIAFQEGIVSPDYHVYRPSPKYAPSYIDLFVRTPHFATEVSRYSKGVWSSRLRLYPEEFFEILLPVPPLAEQKQIVDYVQSQVTAIDNLNQEVQKGIALLQERRTALIAAAVTGQIDTAEVV